MKKLLCFLLIALVCVPALAFTNTEYRDMLDNPDFARADKRINTLWDKVQRIAPQSVMKFLNQAQAEWWDYGLDSSANDFMGDKKYSREQAYAKATELCADKLELLLNGLSRPANLNEIIGKYVCIGGKDDGWLDGKETGWLEVKWADKKRAEVKVELSAIGGGSAHSNTNTGKWDGRGVIKNSVLAISDEDVERAHIIFVFNKDGTVMIATTSGFEFPHHSCCGLNVFFDGVYVRK